MTRSLPVNSQYLPTLIRFANPRIDCSNVSLPIPKVLDPALQILAAVPVIRLGEGQNVQFKLRLLVVYILPRTPTCRWRFHSPSFFIFFSPFAFCPFFFVVAIKASAFVAITLLFSVFMG